MKGKIKYFVVIFTLIFSVYVVIKLPSVYFKIQDSKIINRIEVNKINFDNIYDNYNLSNEDKFKILVKNDFSSSYFVLYENFTKEKYEELLSNISVELTKIDEKIGELFTSNLMFPYESLTEKYLEKNYITADGVSTTFRHIFYSNDEFFVEVLMDVYDNTIFSFQIRSKNKYIPFNISENEFKEKYKKYLNINNRLLDILFYVDYNDKKEDSYFSNTNLLFAINVKYD